MKRADRRRGLGEETNQSGSRDAIVRMLPQVRPEATPPRPEPRAPTSVLRRVPVSESLRTADSFSQLVLQGDRFLLFTNLDPIQSLLKERSRRDENRPPPRPYPFHECQVRSQRHRDASGHAFIPFSPARLAAASAPVMLLSRFDLE